MISIFFSRYKVLILHVLLTRYKVWNLPNGTPWASEPSIMFNTNIFFPGIKYETSQKAPLERASQQLCIIPMFSLTRYKVSNLPNGTPWASELTIMLIPMFIFPGIKYETPKKAPLERASHQSNQYLFSRYKVWNLPKGPPWASEPSIRFIPISFILV